MESGVVEQANREQRRKRRNLWLIITALVTIFILLPLGSIVLLHYVAAARIEEVLDRFRAQGLPVTPKELNAWYAYPTGDNAADLYTEAFSLLNISVDEDLDAIWEALDAGDDSGIVALLDRNITAIMLLHDAARVDGSRYPLNLSVGGYQLRIPNLNFALFSNELLLLESRVRARGGDKQGVFESIRDALKLSDSYRNEPVLIAQLVRVAMYVRAVETIEQLVNERPWDDALLAQLADVLKSRDDLDAMRVAFMGEMALSHTIFDAPSKEIGSLIGVRTAPLMAYKAVGMGKLDHRYFLEYMWRMYEVAGLPLHERVESAFALAESVEREREGGRGFYWISGVLLPAMARPVLIEVQAVAQMRCARVALAVERYRLAEGKLPDSLDALAPRFIEALPGDPFTGKPLIYKKLKTGYVVYSLGQDKEDNGGRKNEIGQDVYGPGADIPFRVER